jgi:hypothetical protein
MQPGQDVRDIDSPQQAKYIVTARWLTDLNEIMRAVCVVLTREERVQFGITDQKPTCPTE